MALMVLISVSNGPGCRADVCSWPAPEQDSRPHSLDGGEVRSGPVQARTAAAA